MISGNAENDGNESSDDDLDFSTLFLFCPKFVDAGLRVGSKIAG